MPVTIRQIDSFTAPGLQTLPGAVTRSYALWSGSERSAVPNVVWQRDLATHRTTIAHRAQPGWTLDWVRASEQWMVWMEAKATLSQDEERWRWRLHVKRMGEDSPVVMASNTAESDLIPPSPELDGSHLVWCQETTHGKNVHVMDLQSQTKPGRPLLTDRRVLTAGVTDGQLVFLEEVAGRRDLFAMPLGGGSVRRLTTSGNVRFTNVANGYAAYEEGPLESDPQRQFLVPVAGTPKPVLVTGPAEPGQSPPGSVASGANGLVAWFDTVGISVGLAGVESSTVQVTDEANVALRLVWSGNRLMWGKSVYTGSTYVNTIVISDVAP